MDDKRTVHPDETVGRQGFLDSLHAHQRHHGSPVFGMYLYVIFHAFDIQDLIEAQLHHLVFGLDEKSLRGSALGNRPLLFAVLKPEPTLRFVGGPQELGITDRFEQVIQRIDPESFQRVLFKRCRKNHPRLRSDHPRKLQPVELRHLDIQKNQVDLFALQNGQRFDRTGTRSRKMQERRLLYITRQQVPRQRFIVHDKRFDSHRQRFIISCDI